MTAKKPNPMAPLLLQFIIPAIVFISSAGILYSKVSEIGETLKDHTKVLSSMSERITRVETKVEIYISKNP